MFRKLLLALAAFIATMGFAFAQVDVNKADQAALDSVKGIGPKMSKSIIDERQKNGDFKDWTDFQKRVKGIGDKNSDKLSSAGLTVNGQAKPNAPAAKGDTKTDAKAKSDSKTTGKSKDATSSPASGGTAGTGAKAGDTKGAKSSSSTGTTGATTGGSTGAASGTAAPAPAAAAGAKK